MKKTFLTLLLLSTFPVRAQNQTEEEQDCNFELRVCQYHTQITNRVALINNIRTVMNFHFQSKSSGNYMAIDELKDNVILYWVEGNNDKIAKLLRLFDQPNHSADK